MPREKKINRNGTNVGFEAQLWQAVVHGGSMYIAQCKQVVFNLISFLPLSETLDGKHTYRSARRLARGNVPGADKRVIYGAPLASNAASHPPILRGRE